MKYCENCYFATNETRCPVCASKKLRDIQIDDFCYVVEGSTAYCENLMDIFRDNEIPYSTLSYGDGTRSYSGLRLENYRLYVPYRFLQKAKNIIVQIEYVKSEKLRKVLLDNLDKLNISVKLEKRIRKKLKLKDTENILDYCANIIESADRIVDRGEIPLDKNHGRYFLCYYNDKILEVNSGTLEVLSLA